MFSIMWKKGFTQIPLPRTLNEMETPFSGVEKPKHTPSCLWVASGVARGRCRLALGPLSLPAATVCGRTGREKAEEAFSFCCAQQLVRIIRTTDGRCDPFAKALTSVTLGILSFFVALHLPGSSQLTGGFSRPWLWLFLRKILGDLKLDPKYSVSLWLCLPRSYSRIWGGRAKLVSKNSSEVCTHAFWISWARKVSMWGSSVPCPPWKFQCFPASVGTGTTFLHPCSSRASLLWRNRRSCCRDGGARVPEALHGLENTKEPFHLKKKTLFLPCQRPQTPKSLTPLPEGI